MGRRSGIGHFFHPAGRAFQMRQRREHARRIFALVFFKKADGKAAATSAFDAWKPPASGRRISYVSPAK